MRPVFLKLLPLAAALLAAAGRLPASPRPEDALADPGFGQGVFRQNCALCHDAGPGAAGGGQGPSLAGLLGRSAGTRPDFGYTPALRASGLVWDAATLDRFLADPTSIVPGTTMVIGVPKPNDRRDLIAYLATLKPGGDAEAAVDPTATDPNDWRHQKPGRHYLIKPEDLPAPYATKLSRNHPFIVPRSSGTKLEVPAGFTIAPVATNLNGPRLLQVAPNGDIFITEMRANRVRVLRPADQEGGLGADEIYAESLDRAYGLAFYPAGDDPKWLYVATFRSVVRFPYRRGDLRAAGPPETIVRLGVSGGGHGTRSLAFSPDGRRMFIGVGSGSDFGDQIPRKSPAEAAAWESAHGLGAAWAGEFHRANILVTDPMGKEPLRVFASGLRNPTGLAVNPQTGDLYAAVNERDSLGDNLVPDYLTRVNAGSFYGWPWYYIGGHEDPRHAGERSDLAARTTVPDVLFQAHSAALGIAFYTATTGRALFPPEYRGEAFVALHGSWNRLSRTGYTVVRVRMRNGRPTGEYEDFLVGFVASPRNVWGRPVGLAVAGDGALLVTDDENGTLWRIAGPGLAHPP